MMMMTEYKQEWHMIQMQLIKPMHHDHEQHLSLALNIFRVNWIFGLNSYLLSISIRCNQHYGAEFLDLRMHMSDAV